MDMNASLRYQDSEGAQEWFCFAICVTTTFALIPIEIWCIIKFCNGTKTMKMISRRHPMVNVVIATSILLLNIGCMSILMFQSEISNSPSFGETANIAVGFSSMFVSIAGYWAVLRCWIIYYQSQLSNLISSKHWKLMINSKLDKHNLNKTQLWILKNHKKWGNWQFLKRLCIIVNIISTAVAIVAFIL